MKGKPATFKCTWCEQKVNGSLILEVKDYVSKVKRSEYICPDCSHRVTKIVKKL